MRDNTLHLQCKVDAFPAPTMAIFRDSELKQSVMSDDRISITAKGDEEDSATFYLSMKIATSQPHSMILDIGQRIRTSGTRSGQPRPLKILRRT